MVTQSPLQWLVPRGHTRNILTDGASIVLVQFLLLLDCFGQNLVHLDLCSNACALVAFHSLSQVLSRM